MWNLVFLCACHSLMSRRDAEGKENGKPDSVRVRTPTGVDGTEGVYCQIEVKICNIGLR